MLLHDLRHAVRALARTPAVTVLALTALAVGIGANSAIFSIVDGVLIEPLPYEAPEQLAIVWERNFPRSRDRNVVAPANYLAWVDRQQSFDRLVAFGGGSLNLTGAGEPTELDAQRVSDGFFEMLGARPMHGRTFAPTDHAVGAESVVIIGHELWHGRFGGDPSLVGRAITLDAIPYTVIGVMPSDFQFFWPDRDVWVPMRFDADDREPSGRSIFVVGRTAPGVTMEQAQADMERVSAALVERWPDFNTGWGVNVVPLREQIVGEVRPALLVLLGAVAFVVLIACANVANLLLVRGTARRRELTIRTAIGADRQAIVRQLLVEALVLAAAGGLAGLGLAWLSLEMLRAAVAETISIPRLDRVGLDATVLGYTAAISVLTAIISGLLPALTASSVDLTSALKEGGRSGGTGRSRRLRGAFVIIEVALAFVLLIGAGLLIRSFERLMAVDPGFRPDSVLTFGLELPGSAYAEDHQRVEFFDSLTDRLDSLPGVQAVGGIAWLPMNGVGAATSFTVNGRPEPDRGQRPVTDVRWVTGDYFDVMGIPLLKGRTFDERDTFGNDAVVVVNEMMARQLWGDTYEPGGVAGDPIGRGLNISWDRDTPERIIGVVGDVKLATLDGDVRPTIYWPHPRVPFGFMTMVMRASGEPEALAAAAIAEVRALDPNLPVSPPRAMTQVLADSVSQPRLTMALLGIFAAVALLLAAVGLYGVVSTSVAQRRHEIGLRMALGARRGQVMGMVLREGGLLVTVGLAVGILASVALTRLMASLLFGVSATDVPTYVAIAVALVAVSLAAAYAPARRATGVDPNEALRYE